MAIDYFREFSNSTGTRGSSDIMCKELKRVEQQEFKDERICEDESRRGFEQLIQLGNLISNEKAVCTLYYRYGYDLYEIGDIFGVSESRICQIKKRSEERIQKGLSSKEQGTRKQEKCREISQKIQDKSFVRTATKIIQQELQNKERKRMGEKKIKKIQEEILGSFRINTF